MIAFGAVNKNVWAGLGWLLLLAFRACDRNAAEPMGGEGVVCITTESVTDIAMGKALLNGCVRAEVPDGEAGFLLSTSPHLLFEEARELIPSEIDGRGHFSVWARSLLPSTTYYCRAFLRKSDRLVMVGDILSFITLELAYTDLGLGVKWANVNIPAGNDWDDCSPSDYGGYYAWGESGTKSRYLWETYRLGAGYRGADGVSTLAREDDVASVRLGDRWRLPTQADWQELSDTRENPDYRWTWKTEGGRAGWEVAFLPTGNAVFFPAAGHQYDVTLYDAGEGGAYWSSSLDENNPDYAYCLFFDSEKVDSRYLEERCLGCSVRPVF